MLKITWVTRRRRAPILKLEGELLEPWVEVVRDACAPQALWSQHARLDLSAVIFVDAAGVALLRDLIRQGMAVNACSRFIAELLRRETTEATVGSR
jgi:ABC-type transporter Mla MlaB component